MTDVIEDEAPRLNKRDHAKIRTREKVLAAARKLFASEGHHGATIRGIAKEAGMSTGAVFANFKDKADLYVAAHGHNPITPEQGVVLLDMAEKSWRELFYAQQDEYDSDRQELMGHLMEAIRSVKPDFATAEAAERSRREAGLCPLED